MFSCADGSIILVAYLDAHWRKLLDILNDDSLRDDPRFADPQTRVIHRDLLTERLAAHLRERRAQDWVDLLSAAGILVARVKDYRDVTTAAVTDESGILFEDDGFHAVRSPVQLIGTETPVPAPLRYAEAADLADQFHRGSARSAGTANRNEESSMTPDGPRLKTIQAEAGT
jgi:crotonobetainyl-CoA:carnitine CoA-transferase CaiB-like acyl-CoA transferase